MDRASILTSDLGTLLEQKNVSTEKDQLIEILHIINDTFGCLPKPYLRAAGRLPETFPPLAFKVERR